MKQVIRRHVAVLLVIFLVSTVWAQQAKYVFYFIGDGMGVNQVMVLRCIWLNRKGVLE